MPAEWERDGGFRSDRIVAGDALWESAWFSCAEEDMGGGVVLAVIGSEIGVGRLGCERVALRWWTEHGEFRSCFLEGKRRGRMEV